MAILNICQEYANILGGKGKEENGVCTVTKDRKNISASILGKPFHSLEMMFNFEIVQDNLPTLNTGEIVLLEREVPKVVYRLLQQGIVVSAVHNHWLNDSPKLIYIHFEVVMEPLEFARKMASVLTSSNIA